MPSFARAAALTLSARVAALLLGVATSVLLTRTLGPAGKGTYALATLLPSLIISFADLGLGAAATYHTARGVYSRALILGNGIVLNVGLAVLATVGGAAIIASLGGRLFPQVAPGLLFLGLASILPTLLITQMSSVLVGLQQFWAYNAVALMHAAAFLIFLAVGRLAFGDAVSIALLAGVAASALVAAVLFAGSLRLAGGVLFRLDKLFIRDAGRYGVQTQVGSLLSFLNYRADVFITSAMLGATAVGFYSTGVTLVEQLWLVSSSAGTVLFPRVAAGTGKLDGDRFTAMVARIVLWLGALAALFLLLVSRALVRFLYTDAFLPSVAPLQALLPGVVVFGAARVLANDLAGRGRVMLNNAAAVVTVITNVSLNLLWIPRYGIVGAAWASTVSYAVTFLAQAVLHCLVTKQSWTQLVVPQREDLAAVWKAMRSVLRWS